MLHLVFDLGGVLIGWDPGQLYRKVFDQEEEVQYFLQEICPMDWNEEMDAGKPFAQGISERVSLFPNYRTEIEAYFDRWPEMLTGPIKETVELFKKLALKSDHQTYAITNWSSETFPVAQQKYAFLDLFDGLIVSGQEGIAKPNPQIFQLLFDRYRLIAKDCVFIDDNLRNIEAANSIGMHGVHYTSHAALEEALHELGVQAV